MQSATCCIVFLLSHGLAKKNLWRWGSQIGMRRREAYRSELLCGDKTQRIPVCRLSRGHRVVAHLDILLEALYCRLECLLKNTASASNCCKEPWTC